MTAALNCYGILHVAPGARVRGWLPREEELLVRLASSSSVRLREAVIPLLLTHPELADQARRAIDRLEGNDRIKAMYGYVAACALQRMWQPRLDQEFGRKPLLPEAYLDVLGLPSLDEDFGRETLLALSNQEEERFGYDAWEGYNSLMDLFLNELIDPSWGKSRA